MLKTFFRYIIFSTFKAIRKNKSRAETNKNNIKKVQFIKIIKIN